MTSLWEAIARGVHVLIIIVTNKIFLSAFIAWFIAQTIKVMIHLIVKKKFDFRLFVGTGGMPSSHTASVTAGTTYIGLVTGWESAVFMVSLLYCVVVVSDAMGVRRAAGNQARVLNKMLDEIEHHDLNAEKRLKELLGHTPLEAIAGLVLGISFAIWFYHW